MEPGSRVRWVGFDMDECIGFVMPVYFPITFVSATDADVKNFVKGELTGETYVIRKSFVQLLYYLYESFVKHEIAGAFILSNNGSSPLVDFMVRTANHMIQMIFGLPEPARVFQMGISSESDIRLMLGEAYQYEKSYKVVQHCLTMSGLSPCSSPNDLIFFDDQVHVLTSQIPHYCRVREYKHVTPMGPLLSVLGIDTTTGLGSTVLHRGSSYIISTLSKGYTTDPPTFAEDMEDISYWVGSYRRFLAPVLEEVVDAESVAESEVEAVAEAEDAAAGINGTPNASTKIKSRRRKHGNGTSTKTHTIRRRIQGKRRLLGNRNRK